MLPKFPKQPPLEVVEEGGLWVVEQYQQGTRNGTTYSTHSDRLAALRAGKSKLESEHHPCLLQWHAPDSVQNVFWNPLFEYLNVTYDELVDKWAVVPERTPCVITLADSSDAACDQAKRIQRDYNFKHVRAYDREGRRVETRDHRFLRNEITKSGVRFTTDALKSRTTPDVETTHDNGSAATDTGDDISYMQPAGLTQLDISIPDITEVELVDTNGVLLRYHTPWGDGTYAGVMLVSREYATNETLHTLFSTVLSNWREVDATPHVASIYDSGTEPTPWVAYRSGEHTLADIGLDLAVDIRLNLITQLIKGVASMRATHERVCGIRPANIGLRTENQDWRGALANWDLEWRVTETVDQDDFTPFTAPEQLAGRVTDTTCVYQLGAVLYWLLCESPPVDATAPRQALQTGDINPPDTVAGVSPAIEEVLETALARDPSQRYQTVAQLRTALAEHSTVGTLESD